MALPETQSVQLSEGSQSAKTVDHRVAAPGVERRAIPLEPAWPAQCLPPAVTPVTSSFLETSCLAILDAHFPRYTDIGSLYCRVPMKHCVIFRFSTPRVRSRENTSVRAGASPPIVPEPRQTFTKYYSNILLDLTPLRSFHSQETYVDGETTSFRARRTAVGRMR
jgi:hypothetical protein